MTYDQYRAILLTSIEHSKSGSLCFQNDNEIYVNTHMLNRNNLIEIIAYQALVERHVLKANPLLLDSNPLPADLVDWLADHDAYLIEPVPNFDIVKQVVFKDDADKALFKLRFLN